MQLSQIERTLVSDARSISKGMWQLIASIIVFFTVAAGEDSQVNRRRVSKLIDDAGVPEGTRKVVMTLSTRAFPAWKGAVVKDSSPAEVRKALADAMKSRHKTLDGLRQDFAPAKKPEAQDQQPARQLTAADLGIPEAVQAGASEEAPAPVSEDDFVDYVRQHIEVCSLDKLMEAARLIADRVAELNAASKEAAEAA